MRQVRGNTLRFLEETPEADLLWTPPGLSNHTVWRSGHALWVIDRLALEPITGTSELPEGWAETFGGKGRHPSETRDWPSRNALREALEQQRERMLTLLDQATPEQLAGPAPTLSDTWNLAGWITHALHDEALHQGETYLVLKLLKTR